MKNNVYVRENLPFTEFSRLWNFKISTIVTLWLRYLHSMKKLSQWHTALALEVFAFFSSLCVFMLCTTYECIPMYTFNKCVSFLFHSILRRYRCLAHTTAIHIVVVSRMLAFICFSLFSLNTCSPMVFALAQPTIKSPTIYTHTHEHTDIKHMLFNVCARNIVYVVLPVPHYSCSWFVRCAFLFLTCMQLCVRRPQLINKL